MSDSDGDDPLNQMENEVITGDLEISGSEHGESSKHSRKRFHGIKNPIHSHFSYDSKEDVSTCNYCTSKIKKKFPTNLEKHLKSKHPNEFKKFELEKEKESQETPAKISRQSSMMLTQESIEQSFAKIHKKAVGLEKGTIEYQIILESIAVAFVGNSLPHRLVEDRRIRKMFEKISRGYWRENFPSRTEISNKIHELSDNLKNNVASSLKNAKLCSITIDLWSRPGFFSGFIGITAHFYDRLEEKLQVALLACKKIQHPHTAESIYELTQSVLNEWGLDDSKILRIVTDNGSNVVKAFKECLILLVISKHEESGPHGIPQTELLDINLDISFVEDDDDFEENEEATNLYFERKKRISCFAHNLMLAVRSIIDSDDEIKAVKDDALKLIQSVRASPKAMELLREKSGGLGLIKPVQTRWVYWYYTFQRLIRIKKAVCEICIELKIVHKIGPMQWEMLEAITDLLHPFAQAVTKLEGEKYVTISEVYPTLYSLIKKMEMQEPRIFEGISTLAQSLKIEIEKRFVRVLDTKSDAFDPIFVLSTFLDPRFSLLLEGDLLKAAEEELMRMAATYGGFISSTIEERNEDVQEDLGDLSDDLLAIAKAKIEERRRSNPQNDSSVQFNNELKMYSNDTKSMTQDPMDYWRGKKHVLSLLYSVAIDVLAVPATSAPVERVFSKASLVLKKNRHNLSDKKMELEVFYKMNSSFLE